MVLIEVGVPFIEESVEKSVSTKVMDKTINEASEEVVRVYKDVELKQAFMLKRLLRSWR